MVSQNKKFCQRTAGSMKLVSIDCRTSEGMLNPFGEEEESFWL